MSHAPPFGQATSRFSSGPLRRAQAIVSSPLLRQLAIVFLAYFIAGKLGQATTAIRSSNLGPVWPAFGIALAAFLAYGYRVWPGIAASAFVVAARVLSRFLPRRVRRSAPPWEPRAAPSCFIASPISSRRSRDCVMRSA